MIRGTPEETGRGLKAFYDKYFSKTRNTYTVITLQETLSSDIIKEVNTFNTAKDVGIFMWGRSTGKHLIYRNGQLAHLAHLCGDITELEHYLSLGESKWINYL